MCLLTQTLQPRRYDDVTYVGSGKVLIVRRIESVSIIHHGHSVVVSSTADQTQRNFFFRIMKLLLPWNCQVAVCSAEVTSVVGNVGC